jgi:hypothetical protein
MTFGTKFKCDRVIFLTLLSLMLNTQNFMKCLMQMFAEADKGVVFFETVLSLSKQKHTFIECVPLPWSVYDDIPAYFKVILPSPSCLAANEK